MYSYDYIVSAFFVATRIDHPHLYVFGLRFTCKLYFILYEEKETCKINFLQSDINVVGSKRKLWWKNILLLTKLICYRRSSNNLWPWSTGIFMPTISTAIFGVELRNKYGKYIKNMKNMILIVDMSICNACGNFIYVPCLLIWSFLNIWYYHGFHKTASCSQTI